MKLWSLLPVCLGLVAISRTGRPSDPSVILITGDSRGSLAPCGCTKPMTGGLTRLATAIRAYREPGRTVLLANGDLTGGISRQEVLKAQTLAEALRELDVTAVNLGSGDQRNLEATASIKSFLSDQILTDEHPVEVGNVRLLTDAARSYSNAGQDSNPEVRVAMIDGGLAEAQSLAEKQPALSVIQYRLDGRATWSKVGTTLLVTPGSKLRDLVVIPLSEGSPLTPKIVPLDEHVADDPVVKSIYRNYLARVTKENLIAQFERSGSERFTGTKKCISCHGASGKVWEHSRHAVALASLEKLDHGKDPECVPCHVVGLDQTYGFRDRLKTRDLANVGCESCHGAGGPHATNPTQAHFQKVPQKRCQSCHTSEQSPNFDFVKFWKEIRH